MTTVLADTPINAITVHPRNPRRALGDLDDLTESIREKGILEPLIIAPWPTDARRRGRKVPHVLIAGHRRLAAAKAAGLTTVPTIHRDDLTTTTLQVEAMLIENLHRADLTPVEEAEAYQMLLDLGLDEKTIATQVGQPVSRVKSRAKLIALPEPAKAKLHHGQTTITDALALLEFAGDQDTLTRLTKALATTSFAWQLREAQGLAKHNRDLADDIAAVEKAGFPVRETVPAGAKRLGTRGWAGKGEVHYYPNPSIGSSERKYALKNHCECPGRLVVVEAPSRYQPDRKEVVHYCTTPQAHPRPKGVRDPTEAQAKKEREALRAATGDKAAIAGDLRWAWLREDLLPVITEQTAHGVLVDLTIDTVTRDYECWSLAMRLLDITLPEPESPGEGISDGKIGDLLRPRLARLTLPQLALVTLVSAYPRGEAALGSAEPTLGRWDRDHGREWLTILVGLGYTASDFERDRFLTGGVSQDEDAVTAGAALGAVAEGSDDEIGDADA